MKRVQFKKEYKLGEGYPFVKHESGVYKQFVFLKDKKLRFWDTFALNYPQVFETLTKDTPRYELILRRTHRVKSKKRSKISTKNREKW